VLPQADAPQTSLFASLAAQPPAAALSGGAPAGVSVAQFQGFDLLGRPLVGGLAVWRSELMPARSTVPLSANLRRRSVVVVFEEGDVLRPIILGVLDATPVEAVPGGAMSVEADEESVTIRAQRQIVLQCGDASITLTQGGKVLIRGNYVLTRASGCNRIKGATVDIN
jgi:hypothetical protein